MSNIHLAVGTGNGAAVATHPLIYTVAVGGDIGCGAAAVAFDGAAAPLARRSVAAALRHELTPARSSERFVNSGDLLLSTAGLVA
jgi:hypothetical protein